MLDSRRKGSIGRALAKTLKAEALDGMDADERAVVVVLAKRTADVADAAFRVNDARLFLSAESRLMQLLRSLDVRVESPGGGDHDDDAGISGAVQRELAELMGSGPTLPDAP